jgi:sphinganine-1-phosphate aldolase
MLCNIVPGACDLIPEVSQTEVFSSVAVYTASSLARNCVGDRIKKLDPRLFSVLTASVLERIWTQTWVGPATLITGGQVVADHLEARMRPYVGETRRDQLNRICRRFCPPLKRMIDAGLNKELKKSCDKVLERNQKLDAIDSCRSKEMPECGSSTQEVLQLIHDLCVETQRILHEKKMSGTAYAAIDFTQVPPVPNCTGFEKPEDPTSPEGIRQLSRSIQFVTSYAEACSKYYNSLHGSEFPIGSWLNHSVVRMVASLRGWKPEHDTNIETEIHGHVTSGGTESLMYVVRSMLNWGREVKGYNRDQGVIFCLESIHAGVQKGVQAYGGKLVLIKVNEKGEIDLADYEKKLAEHKDEIVGFFASTPSYPTGVADPYKLFAQKAKELGTWMHIDACLGETVFSPTEMFLDVPGVTSVSADLHKNFLCPKGCAAVYTKALNGVNLTEYGNYSLAYWEGGAYGTQRDAGSEAVVPKFQSFATLRLVGRDLYMRLGRMIRERSRELAATINEIEGLSLVVEPEANVVTFKVDPAEGLGTGASYTLAHFLKEGNFIVSAIKGDRLHFCFTAAHRAEPNFLGEFKKALELALAKTKAHVQEGKGHAGDAGTYGDLGNFENPNVDGEGLQAHLWKCVQRRELPSTAKLAKCLEGFFGGSHASKGAVTAHFRGEQNPQISSFR